MGLAAVWLGGSTSGGRCLSFGHSSPNLAVFPGAVRWALSLPRHLWAGAGATDEGVIEGDQDMNKLKWWFRIVCGFYTILGLGFIPPINA